MSKSGNKIVDVLHPLSVLNWQVCQKWRTLAPTCCAVLGDTVCIATRCPGSGDYLHVSTTPELNEWKTIETKYELLSLATFKSKFVAIGGFNHDNKTMSNEVRLLNKDLEYEDSETLPNMSKMRSSVSSINISADILVAAGGKDSDKNNLNMVEILVNKEWIIADSLPQNTSSMKCTIYKNRIYFLSDSTIMYCIYEDLLSKAQSKGNGVVWETYKLSHYPLTIASFGQRLISVDEEATVRALNNETDWTEITSINNTTSSAYSEDMIAAIMGNGDLIIGYGSDALYRIHLTDTGPTMNSLHSLQWQSKEGVQEICIINEVKKDWKEFCNYISSNPKRTQIIENNCDSIEKCCKDAFDYWLNKQNEKDKTWQFLIDILEKMKYTRLAFQLRECISYHYRV